MSLTVLFAAQIFGTSRVLANDGFVTLHAAVVVGAHVARAEELAALAFLALVVVTRHRVCVRDWSVTTIAGDAVAVLRLRGAAKEKVPMCCSKYGVIEFGQISCLTTRSRASRSTSYSSGV